MSYVFWRVPSSIKLRPEIKKVQSPGRRLECFGVPWARIVLAGSLIKLRPKKKGTVVWPSVAMSDWLGGFVAIFFGGFLDQITNYDRKKKVQSALCLQNNPVFLSITISHILKNENDELCFLAGSYLRWSNNYDQKKMYNRLAVGWNKSQITVCCVKIRTPPITL